MNPQTHQAPLLTNPKVRLGGLLVSGLFACSLLTGCRTTLSSVGLHTPAHQPDNVFKLSNSLRADVRRVAVLPLLGMDSRSVLQDGCEALQPILLAEFVKTKRFEVVPVTPQQLRALTGRAAWSATDRLPVDFFEKLRETHACDAVLFAELTEYRAYTPVAVGWRFKLIDARTHAPLWAGDELFDAQKPEIIAAARKFRATGNWFTREPGAEWAVLHSPQRFAEYSAAQMFDTLPVR
jgi:hypothetical protein